MPEVNKYSYYQKKWRPFGTNQIYQGSGCIEVIPEILELEGWKRVMIVADPGVVKFGGIKPIEEMLKNMGIEYCLFTNIEPNPLQETIEKEAIPMYREFKADVMIAVGGGSTMDSAKGVAIVGESNLSIKEASDSVMPDQKMPYKTYPIIAVPTTCGTGSEVIRNAVISEPNGHKLVPMQNCILPNYAICDPDLLSSMPPHVAAATAMDALVQAVESYVSLAANDFSETMSLRAIELIGQCIRPYYHNRSIKKWANMMSLGCMYAGIAWNTSFIAQIHGSNHPITEILHISHGDACAILFPIFVEWNGFVCKDKFFKVYNLLCPEHPVKRSEFEIRMLVDELIQLNRDLNIMNGRSMAEYGCTEETVDKMLEEFPENGKPTFPRTTTKAQMKEIFMRVMKGEFL
jgi:Alcohol dehydrogenase, class IV